MGDENPVRPTRIEVPVLDLDRVDAIITGMRERWASLHGLAADPVTWMDVDAEWPHPLSLDRSQIRSPRSLGVRIHGPHGEAQIVVYAGGWTDADYVRFGDSHALVSEYVELADADAAQALFDRVITHIADVGAANG